MERSLVLYLLLHYVLLVGTGRLAGAPIWIGRILGASALGALYTVLEPPFSDAVGAWVCMAAILTVAAFGTSRSALRAGLIFVGLELAMGGILAERDLTFRLLVLLAAAGTIALAAAFGHWRVGAAQAPVPVLLTLNGRCTEELALRDTGNLLRDPMSGDAVAVADWQVARELLDWPELTEADFAQPAELLPRLALRCPGLRLRLIPYGAVGVKSGLLAAVRLDGFQVAGEEQNSGLVAFSPTPVASDGSYRLIIGGETVEAAGDFLAVSAISNFIHRRQRCAACAAEGRGGAAAAGGAGSGQRGRQADSDRA